MIRLTHRCERGALQSRASHFSTGSFPFASRQQTFGITGGQNVFASEPRKLCSKWTWTSFLAIHLASTDLPVTQELPPLLHGAGQEAGRRASTENVIHIAAGLHQKSPVVGTQNHKKRGHNMRHINPHNGSVTCVCRTSTKALRRFKI